MLKFSQGNDSNAFELLSCFRWICLGDFSPGLMSWHLYSHSSRAQISKATTLQKTADYISKMQQERAQLHEEAQRLRDEILTLNSAIKWVHLCVCFTACGEHSYERHLHECVSVIVLCLCSVCQQQLPATGVPITRQRYDHMREKFREYVRTQTLQNWKFWVVSYKAVSNLKTNLIDRFQNLVVVKQPRWTG